MREETPSRHRAHSNASVCRTLFLDSMSAAYFCFRTLAPVDVLDDDVIVDPAFSFSFIAARVAECGRTHSRARGEQTLRVCIPCSHFATRQLATSIEC